MIRMLGMLFGCALAAGLLGLGLWLSPGVEIPADEADARAAIAPAPPDPVPDVTSTTPEVIEPDGPRVDVLRVEVDGATLVSGRATPGAEVEILTGEQTAGVAPVDPQGNFVAFLSLPESDAPQTLNLRERHADGTARTGRQSFVVEPRPAAEGRVRDMPPDGGAPAATVHAAPLEDQPAPVPAATVVADGPRNEAAVREPASEDEEPTDPREVRADLAEGARADRREPAVVLDASGPDASDVSRASAAQPNVASNPPDAPEPDTRTAAVSGGRGTEDAPVSTDRPEPPQPIGAATESGENGIAPAAPAVQAATPHDEPAVVTPARAPGRTSAPPVIDVPAQPDPPRVLRVENGSLSVMQDGAPNPALSIDTIRYAPDGTVVLGGRAPQATSVRAYLDNRPLDVVRSGADGQWRLDLPALAEGTYNLRVDQLDAEGEVVARAETPFRPESPASLDALGGMVEDGVRRVTVQPGFTLWAIAERNYGDGQSFVRVFEANTDKIRNPDLIYPGQIFAVPD